jgi:protein-tyrosine phosphatase
VLRAIAAREYPHLPVEVDSAGTAGFHVGEPPDRRTVAAARRRGYEISALRARQIQRDDFERFDYVLAMDRANLAELQRLAGPDASAQPGLFMSYAGHADLLEVPDPYYSGVEAFEQVLDMCEAASRGLLAHLGTPR